jgi:peroxiredoxin family protein
MSGENAEKESVSIILFSGDLDKAMAAFTIANGAAGSGMSVNMFFTFWGLSLLRKVKGDGHSFLENLFKKMMPAGADSVGLSRFNFGGVGARLLRKMLRQKKAFTPESLIKMAMDRGVNFTVCEASMKILGITREELIDYDQLSISGVDSFLQAAWRSKIQLFI